MRSYFPVHWQSQARESLSLAKKSKSTNRSQIIQWNQRSMPRQSQFKPNFRARKANFPPSLARLLGGAWVRRAPPIPRARLRRSAAADPLAEPIEVEIDHR